MKTYKKVQMSVQAVWISPLGALIDQPHAPAALTAEKTLPVVISFKVRFYFKPLKLHQISLCQSKSMEQSPTDKLAVPQLAKKFPEVYGTSKSFTVVITAHD